jgi:uncharacterized protein YkwD
MPKTTTNHQKKRHGRHHKQGNRYLKTYLPYLPVIISIFVSLLLSSWRPGQQGVLAYATNMSISGLLGSTNSERENNGQADLSLNQRLNSAAQAKANDMVARNYWSHNTPDGQEPWVFFDNAGYSYQKAGENLAYGFATSGDTVVGWMNSPPHRANLLDSGFTDVGFGFANGNNYNNSGQETIVVAMYGKPQTLGASTQQAPAAPVIATPPRTTNKPKSVATPVPAPLPATASAVPTPPVSSAPAEKKAISFPSASAEGLQPITRVQALTKGNAPWTLYAVSLLSGSAVILMLFKHALALRHVLINSEHMLTSHLHHPLFDSILVSLAILGLTLSHTVGYII